MAKKTIVQINQGGVGNEKWYQSRRLQGIALIMIGLIGLNFMPDQEIVAQGIIALGASMSGYSWLKPVK